MQDDLHGILGLDLIGYTVQPVSTWIIQTRDAWECKAGRVLFVDAGLSINEVEHEARGTLQEIIERSATPPIRV